MVQIHNTQSFSVEIESLVKGNRGLTYLDAIVHYCDKNEIEIETGAKLINTIIKKKVEAEALELNCLKEKQNQLPI
tara:strand:+ start:576 stop:803 length:228 start_codon:yes stop_codon:yes gene_type:complete